MWLQGKHHTEQDCVSDSLLETRKASRGWFFAETRRLVSAALCNARGPETEIDVGSIQSKT